MKIYLPRQYRNANGVRIAAGEYDINNKALNGLGKYLLSTNHATAIGEPELVIELDEPATEETIEDMADVVEEKPTRKRSSK